MDPLNAPPPRIHSNRRRDLRTVEVRYVLPDGREALVAVPHSSWLDGTHVGLGRHVAKFLDDVALRPAARESTIGR